MSFHNKTKYSITFKNAPDLNWFKKAYLNMVDIWSRIRLKSWVFTWQFFSKMDLNQVFSDAWKPGSFISKLYLLKGTIYVTADPNVMRAIFYHPRKEDEGLFFDTNNKKMLIEGVLTDLFPEKIEELGVDIVADMVVFTTNASFLKLIRSSLFDAVGPDKIKDFLVQLDVIVDDILDGLSADEKANCDAEALGYEFAVTAIAQLITTYKAPREDYRKLAHIFRTLSKHMAKIAYEVNLNISTKKSAEYQQALGQIKVMLDAYIRTPELSPYVSHLKNMGWDDFRIWINLFTLFFAGSETTASSINYMLWQLGKPENRGYLEELRQNTDETLTSKIIDEVLRLHPSVYVDVRQFRSDTLLEIKDEHDHIIKEMRFPKEHFIVLLTRVLGSDPSNFKDPECFNPHRFDEGCPHAPLYPFGAGYHACPGQHLAQAELKTLLTNIVSRFNIETLSPKETHKKGLFILQIDPTYVKFTDLKISD